MSPWTAAAVLVALVALASLLGLVHRARAGRLRAGSGAEVTAAQLGLDGAFGDRATLVQLSTPTCAQCPGTARLLGGIAEDLDGVVHAEVDLTRHPDVADRFGVLQTPTTWAPARRFRRAAKRCDGRARRGLLVDLFLALTGAGVAATVLLAAICAVFAWGAFAGIERHPDGRLFRTLVRPRLQPPVELEEAAPPTFAQGVGFVITFVGVVLGAFGLAPGLAVFAAMAFVAAFLNAVFGTRLGCRMYVLLLRARIIRPA